MSDELKLGQIIENDREDDREVNRDAIHIAVSPVIAS
jgi:hypothetical protein